MVDRVSPSQPAEAAVATTPLLIGARDAARLLGIGERLVWSLSVSGELPSVRVGRRRLYSVETLRAWIAAREREGLR